MNNFLAVLLLLSSFVVLIPAMDETTPGWYEETTPGWYEETTPGWYEETTAPGDGGGGEGETNCKSFATKDNIYYFGKYFTSEFGVLSSEKCARACFEAKTTHDVQCLSANYWDEWDECGLFEDQTTVFTGTNVETTEGVEYIYNVNCDTEPSQTTTPQPQPTTTVTPKPPSTGSCGIADVRISRKVLENQVAGRIVNGVDSKPHGWPWLVSIQNKREGKWIHWCGGSVIRLADNLEKTDVIITAEHCIGDKNQNYVDVSTRQVVAGEYDLKKAEAGNPEVVRAALAFHSPGGQPWKDIALIILTEEIEFKKEIQPVCLPEHDKHDPPEGKMCVVTGWGDTTGGGNYPDRPKEVAVPITHKYYAECAAGKPDICAGYQAGGKDSCSGDSGGPLNCELTPGKWTLSGVVSRGQGCALAGHPGLYAKPTYNFAWIKSTICAHSKFKNQIPGCTQD